MNRKTIVQDLTIEGIGLHKGQHIRLCLRPSDKGIVFIKDGVRIPAIPDNVVDTRLNTTLGSGNVRISTIEHLMFSFYCLTITDCEIEVIGDEIPAMDGSALPFIHELEKNGMKDLGTELKPIEIEDTVRSELGDAWVQVSPGPFSVSYEIEFSEAAIGTQKLSFNSEDYSGKIAPARTFGLLKDVQYMRSMGLALGGGLHNAVVVDRDKVLNSEGLRFRDEFVRHKILDILGDLWIIGAPIKGHVQAYKANHALHIDLAKKIYSMSHGG